ncbi:MAG TPA: hypothetical protein VKU19_10250 [Bryobacteraceae bacterium]|nr:hypothetical protein [Bryobacteraceae bacterium]
MKTLALSLMVAGAMTLTGCSNVVSLNPFVTTEQAVMDPALLGTWISSDGKDIYSIRQDGSGYTIRYLTDSSEVYQVKARLMTAGDVKILDVTAANEDPFQLAVHTGMRVWTDGDTLRFAILQTDWLKEQALRQLSTAPISDRMLITSPGDAVGAFLAKAASDAKATDEAEVLHRVQ